MSPPRSAGHHVTSASSWVKRSTRATAPRPNRRAAEADLTERVELLAQRRHPHDENRKLVQHLHRNIGVLFTFLTDPTIDATSWRAEQGIRPTTVTRKVCGGNRSDRGALTQGRMMTLFRTASQQGIDAVDYLVNLARAPDPTTTSTTPRYPKTTRPTVILGQQCTPQRAHLPVPAPRLRGSRRRPQRNRGQRRSHILRPHRLRRLAASLATFTGSITGCPGTTTATCRYTAQVGIRAGTFHVVRGSGNGGLTGLHGTGTSSQRQNRTEAAPPSAERASTATTDTKTRPDARQRVPTRRRLTAPVPTRPPLTP